MRWWMGAAVISVIAGAAMGAGAQDVPPAGEGAEDLPPPPPPPASETVPPPPPGYGEAQPAPEYPAPEAVQPGPAYPQHGGYYPPPPQQPPPPAADPGRHRHDGFFLRANIGPSYLSASTDDGLHDVSIYGGGINLSVAIGGAIAENVVLYGDLYGVGVPGPNLQIEEDALEAREDVSLSYGGLGLGLAWFIMPANIYVSGSIGFVNLTMESDFEVFVEGSRVGPGLNVMVGKEFWVGSDWGMGFAGQLLLGSSTASMQVGPTDPLEEVTFTTFGLGLSFSATFN